MKAELPRSTFIYVTHNPREAMSVGDKLLIMGNGRLLQYGEKERVWKNPYCADVLRTLCADPREFVGSIKDGAFSGCVQNGIWQKECRGNWPGWENSRQMPEGKLPGMEKYGLFMC